MRYTLCIGLIILGLCFSGQLSTAFANPNEIENAIDFNHRFNQLQEALEEEITVMQNDLITANNKPNNDAEAERISRNIVNKYTEFVNSFKYDITFSGYKEAFENNLPDISKNIIIHINNLRTNDPYVENSVWFLNDWIYWLDTYIQYHDKGSLDYKYDRAVALLLKYEQTFDEKDIPSIEKSLVEVFKEFSGFFHRGNNDAELDRHWGNLLYRMHNFFRRLARIEDQKTILKTKFSSIYKTCLEMIHPWHDPKTEIPVYEIAVYSSEEIKEYKANPMSLDDMRKVYQFDEGNLAAYFSYQLLKNEVSKISINDRNSIKNLLDHYEKLNNSIATRMDKLKITDFILTSFYKEKLVNLEQEDELKIPSEGSVLEEENLVTIEYYLSTLLKLFNYATVVKIKDGNAQNDYGYMLSISEMQSKIAIHYFKSIELYEWQIDSNNLILNYYKKSNRSYSIDIDINAMKWFIHIDKLKRAKFFIDRAILKWFYMKDKKPNDKRTFECAAKLLKVLDDKYNPDKLIDKSSAISLTSQIDGFDSHILDVLKEYSGKLETKKTKGKKVM